MAGVTTTTPAMLDLMDLCKNQTDVIVLLKSKGIHDTFDLSEVTENDIRQLKLKNLVVRRRLIRYIQETSKPLPVLSSLEELCKHHARSLTSLRKSGVSTLDDLKELESEDITELEIINIPVLRRINKYISHYKLPSSCSSTTEHQHPKHQRKSSVIESATTITESTEDPRSPSVMLRSRNSLT